MDLKNIEKFFFKKLRKNSELLNIITNKAKTIFNECLDIWILKQENQSDINDPKLWIDILCDSEKKFEELLFKAMQELIDSVRYHCIGNVFPRTLLFPSTFLLMFDFVLQEFIENVDLKKLTGFIMQYIYDDWKEKKLKELNIEDPDLCYLRSVKIN